MLRGPRMELDSRRRSVVRGPLRQLHRAPAGRAAQRPLALAGRRPRAGGAQGRRRRVRAAAPRRGARSGADAERIGQLAKVHYQLWKRSARRRWRRSSTPRSRTSARAHAGTLLHACMQAAGNPRQPARDSGAAPARQRLLQLAPTLRAQEEQRASPPSSRGRTASASSSSSARTAAQGAARRADEGAAQAGGEDESVRDKHAGVKRSRVITRQAVLQLPYSTIQYTQSTMVYLIYAAPSTAPAVRRRNPCTCWFRTPPPLARASRRSYGAAAWCCGHKS